MGSGCPPLSWNPSAGVRDESRSGARDLRTAPEAGSRTRIKCDIFPGTRYGSVVRRLYLRGRRGSRARLLASTVQLRLG